MFNLIKQYNALLEVDAMTPAERKVSLRRIFNRDIQDNNTLSFRDKKIYPVPREGMDKLEMLFWHLTTKVINHDTNHREYDRARSIRLHWIKFHIEEHKTNDMLIFSTKNGRILPGLAAGRHKSGIPAIISRKGRDRQYGATDWWQISSGPCGAQSCAYSLP